jgi:hypothetical protein
MPLPNKLYHSSMLLSPLMPLYGAGSPPDKLINKGYRSANLLWLVPYKIAEFIVGITRMVKPVEPIATDVIAPTCQAVWGGQRLEVESGSAIGH